MATTPNTPARVLCICPDAFLRSTRQLVLSLRYAAVSIATVDEMQLHAGETFDVVVVCHALRPEECELAVHLAYMLWPAVHVVVLTRTGRPCTWDADTVVSSMDGPETLLDTVDRLLQMPKKPASNQLIRAEQTSSGTAAGSA